MAIDFFQIKCRLSHSFAKKINDFFQNVKNDLKFQGIKMHEPIDTEHGHYIKIEEHKTGKIFFLYLEGFISEYKSIIMGRRKYDEALIYFKNLVQNYG